MNLAASTSFEGDDRAHAAFLLAMEAKAAAERARAAAMARLGVSGG
jgi:hypothetical protein